MDWPYAVEIRLMQLFGWTYRQILDTPVDLIQRLLLHERERAFFENEQLHEAERKAGRS